MDLLLGIDAGTTRVKALLFSLNGHVVGQASQALRLLRPCEGCVEQDPEEIWQALLQTTRNALAQAEPGDRVLALSLSTQAGPTILVDRGGKPLRNAISWMDSRGASEAEALKRKLDPDDLYRASGWWLHGTSVPAHLAWLQQHEPASFESARYYLQVNDFLVQRLTGEPRQDPSNAGYGLLYDIAGGHWNPRVLAALGIDEGRLPPVVPSGQPIATLQPATAREMGLEPETIVVSGAHDQYAAAFGAGVVEPGQVLLSCGTAWVLVAATAQPVWGSGPHAMAISRHAAPGRWGALSTLGGVGTTVEWYVEAILAPTCGRAEALAAMDRELPLMPPGAHGLFCFPLDGGHAYWEGGRGALWGLTGQHSRYDIGRAALEGIAFELRWLLEAVRTEGFSPRSLVMVGGAARSSCWPQIIADVTGLAVTVPAIQEAGARGAAMLAALGAGCIHADAGFASLSDGARFNPQSGATKVYDGLYRAYRSAHASFRRSPPVS